MSNSYSSLCDDFYLDMCVNTELELPSQRDTILTFFERVEKQFPSMSNFSRRNNTDCCLQGDRSSGRYRWVALEADRVASGVVNPDSFEAAYEQDRLVLDLMPYMLGINHLDVDSLDVTFAMDFEYSGNHDEVITEALLNETAFGSLLDLPSAKPIVCSPSIVVIRTKSLFLSLLLPFLLLLEPILKKKKDTIRREQIRITNVLC